MDFSATTPQFRRIDAKGLELSQIEHLMGDADDQDVDALHP